MGYECKILLDSISETGKRLTTFQVTFPRIVLAEWNTHRMFSRNSASSRAIPFKKQIERVMSNPFIPERFPIDGKGMQPNSYVENGPPYTYAKNAWKKALESTLISAQNLSESISNLILNKEDATVHKQIVNRLLEPFMWHTVIVTATEFNNFFKLRCDENAQYEIRRIADLMYEAYHAFDDQWINASVEVNGINREWQAIIPQKLKVGEWHTPLVYEEDIVAAKEYLNSDKVESYKHGDRQELLKRISVAHCARISYLTHDGKRSIEKDLELFERLRTSGHWSPFEHIATPYYDEDAFRVYREVVKSGGINKRSGNFIGWKQFRKEFADENCTDFKKSN